MEKWGDLILVRESMELKDIFQLSWKTKSEFPIIHRHSKRASYKKQGKFLLLKSLKKEKKPGSLPEKGINAKYNKIEKFIFLRLKWEHFMMRGGRGSWG